MALVHAGCRPSIGVIYRSKTWCENSGSSLRATSAAGWIPADCHLEDVQPGEQHHPVGIILYNIHSSFQWSFSDKIITQNHRPGTLRLQQPGIPTHGFGRHEGIILLSCLVAEITRKSYLTSASQFHRNLSQAKPTH